jgi:hypothetical protein
MRKTAARVMRDLGTVGLSVAVAVLLVKTGLIAELLATVSGVRLIGGFIAGMLFVSVFTVAPAAAVLIELFGVNSLLEVALGAGLGGLVGDWLMFRFLRNRVADDLRELLRRSGSQRLLAIFRLKCFRWLTPLIGAIIVASPLPDEIGLALMGLSGLRTAMFLPLSFILNFFGILAVGLAVRAVGS